MRLSNVFPFEVSVYEPMSTHVRKLFESYRLIRTKVVGWNAASSEKRAELANRFRKKREIQPGDRLLFRDPRAKAVGGRTAHKEPLSGPGIVESVSGNKVKIRTEDGALTEVHVENTVVVHPDSEKLENARSCKSSTNRK